jgi:hypothetical protein
MPSRFGTWPMMVTQTRPSMKPLITGVGINAATQPIRNAPNSRNKTPIRTASVEVRALVYALLGTSRLLVVGPDTATGLISALTVGGIALQGTAECAVSVGSA